MDATLKLQESDARRLEAVACNLCGSDEARELYASNLDLAVPRSGRLSCTDRALGSHGRIVQCRSCGLLFTNPRESAQTTLDAYGQVKDETYLQEEQGRVDTFRGTLKLMNRYRRAPGSLLDVGCYTGLFLSLARQEGWTVSGVEPSSWACEVARTRYHLEVHPGTLATLEPKAQSFDVVTMWDVLEHYTDPMSELVRCRQLLRQNGILAFTTIDAGSPIAKLLGPRWWWLMEMHLTYFTRSTVTAFLERSGFDVLAIRNHVRIISVRYLWTRLEPWMGPWSRGLSVLGERLRLNRLRLPIVLGDIMTVMAQRRS